MSLISSDYSGKSLVISGQTWSVLKEQATMLVRSGFLPDSIRTPEQALAIAIKGHEVGMPIMQAFSHIHVIKGKPTISAEGMLYLVYKHCPSAVIEFDTTNEYCAIKAARSNNHLLTEFKFTMDDARRAQLLSNPSWTKYPRAMLKARAISEMARTIFADAIGGISYTHEELGADVNEDGEIITIEHTETKQEAAETDGTGFQMSSANSSAPSPKDNPNPTRPVYDKTNPKHKLWLEHTLKIEGIHDPEDILLIETQTIGKTSDEIKQLVHAFKETIALRTEDWEENENE